MAAGKWVVVVRRTAQRDDVVLVGPFDSKQSAQRYLEESHDHDNECDSPCQYLDIADYREAEVLFMNLIPRVY